MLRKQQALDYHAQGRRGKIEVVATKPLLIRPVVLTSVQEAIRDNNLHLLHGLIEASVHVGMHTFDQYLIELLAAGVVTEETARRYAVHRHALDMQLRGIQQPQAILRPERDR